MNFIILNRYIAEQYILNHPHAVISITDIKESIVQFPDNKSRKHVLRLSFYDLDKDKHGHLLDQQHLDGLFNENQAKEILDFIKTIKKENINHLIVQCNAGISRSPAVVAGLAKLEHLDNSKYFTDYLPNKYVYKIILNVANVN